MKSLVLVFAFGISSIAHSALINSCDWKGTPFYDQNIDVRTDAGDVVLKFESSGDDPTKKLAEFAKSLGITKSNVKKMALKIDKDFCAIKHITDLNLMFCSKGESGVPGELEFFSADGGSEILKGRAFLYFYLHTIQGPRYLDENADIKIWWSDTTRRGDFTTVIPKSACNGPPVK